MPDDDEQFHAPPGSSADYQFGMLFAHAKRTDARFKEMRGEIHGLRSDIAAIPQNVERMMKSAVEQLQGSLDAQTAELKPLVNERIARDANAKAQADEAVRMSAQANLSQARSARWMLVGTVVIWALGGLWWLDNNVHLGAPVGQATGKAVP